MTPPRSAPLAGRLVIMAKLPQAGRAKTRLGRQLGYGRAAWIYRHNLELLLQRVAAPSANPRWSTVLAVTPDAAVSSTYFRQLARRFDVRVTGQGDGDLGARMVRLLANATTPTTIQSPTRKAVLIGSDIPGVSKIALQEAFTGLNRAQHVFGPARDGGFWLVGSTAPSALVAGFTEVRWSQSSTLDQVVGNLTAQSPGTHASSVAYARTLSDIDEPADLTSPDVAGAVGRLVPRKIA